jgi:hypothetical protein
MKKARGHRPKTSCHNCRRRGKACRTIPTLCQHLDPEIPNVSNHIRKYNNTNRQAAAEARRRQNEDSDNDGDESSGAESSDGGDESGGGSESGGGGESGGKGGGCESGGGGGGAPVKSWEQWWNEEVDELIYTSGEEGEKQREELLASLFISESDEDGGRSHRWLDWTGRWPGSGK